MVLAYSDRIPRVPPYSGYSLLLNNFTYGAFTLFRRAFQHCSIIVLEWIMESVTPKVLLLLVWALPISLATTFGIVVLLSFPLGN